jgi:hypothetical protein
LTLLLLFMAIVLPALLIVSLVWFARLMAANDVPQDTLGRGTDPRGASWLGRLRIWLTAKPKRLDYRRDKRGRFRKVRRG